jgi:membrane protease YdiL (CAAX protease family)
LTAAIVSPVGEEFFFRGLFHYSLKSVSSNAIATCANSFAFASVHLLVHGVSRDAAGLHVRVGSGLVWLVVVIEMAWVLTISRLRSGSLWPANLARSAGTLVTTRRRSAY